MSEPAKQPEPPKPSRRDIAKDEARELIALATAELHNAEKTGLEYNYGYHIGRADGFYHSATRVLVKNGFSIDEVKTICGPWPSDIMAARVLARERSAA